MMMMMRTRRSGEEGSPTAPRRSNASPSTSPGSHDEKVEGAGSLPSKSSTSPVRSLRELRFEDAQADEESTPAGERPKLRSPTSIRGPSSTTRGPSHGLRRGESPALQRVRHVPSKGVVASSKAVVASRASSGGVPTQGVPQIDGLTAAPPPSPCKSRGFEPFPWTSLETDDQSSSAR